MSMCDINKRVSDEKVSYWTCEKCGYSENSLNFCSECGAKRVLKLVPFRCDKCGWIPENPADPPEFCPNCGDVFNGNDAQLL